ncbi:beta strand repeat-containing protein [Muricoccus radiodurans]|uniref:beta strand repeat-containing protein n=1 Tax=Muricoccus radiodurans TaxID=2231721 RepID=UPI003CE679BB
MTDFPGTPGNDPYVGGDADDTFTASAGNDTFTGGGGFNRAQYFSLAQAIAVTIGTISGGFGGNSVVKGGGLGTDSFSDIDSFSGTAQGDSFTVTAASNPGGTFLYLYGGQGADTIDGGGLTSVFANYDTTSADFAVVLDLEAGTASFRGTTDTLTDVRSARGDDLADSMRGDGFNNYFVGLGGDDTLLGLAGNDTLDSGAGNDFVDGGLDSDFLIGSSGNDTFLGGGGNGSDTLSYAGQSFAINVSFANSPVYSGTVVKSGGNGTDSFTGIRQVNGGSGNDTLTGSDSTVSGLPFSINLRGGLGNDTIDGQDSQLNRASYFDATGGVAVNLTAGTASGAGVGSDTLIDVRRVQGSNFADTLIGSADGDRFDATIGNDTIDGAGGYNIADYAPLTGPVTVTITGIGAGLFGWANGTVVKAGAGQDTLTNVNEFRGTNEADVLNGTTAAYSWNTISLRGGAGNDTINGQDNANNRADYSGATSAVVVDLAAGTAQDGQGGTDTLNAVRNVFGSGFDDTLLGGTGNDSFRVGSGGEHTVDGRGGINTIIFGGSEAVTIDLGTTAAPGGFGGFAGTITKAAGTDQIANFNAATGGQGNDTLRGTSGDDILAGSQGSNLIEGRGGSDTYRASSYAGGDAPTTGAVIDLGNGSTGTATNSWGGTDTLVSIENARGSQFADTITGAVNGGLVSYIRGQGGDDTLRAPTVGTLVTADYAGSLSGVVVNLATGLAADDGWFGGQDTLVNIERARGSAFADSLTGSGVANHLEAGDGDDTVSGGAGNDTLLGGAGSDSLTGGTGNDTFVVGALAEIGAADIIADFAAGDRLDLSALAGTFVGSAPFQNNGTSQIAFRNVLVSGQAVTQIQFDTNGNGSPDALFTLNGTLTLVETATGSRILQVSAAPSGPTSGADSLVGGTGPDSTDGLGGNDTIDGAGGDDTLIGGSGSDTLTGGAGADSLDGGSGDDSMAGGVGDDSYVVNSLGDVVSEAGGDGTDTVTASVSFTLATGFENLVLIGSATTGTGNAAANLITGNGLSNTLLGLGGADTLVGGGGSDTLDGGSEVDSLVGGAGNDVYRVDSALDVVEEGADGAGLDTVEASVTYSIATAAGIERLTLVGGAAINGTGNELANLMTGNAAANRLDGGGGNDTFQGGGGLDRYTGGGGDDTFYVDNAGVVLVEVADGGFDTAYASVSYTLGGQVERLFLTGSATSGTGNGNANRITGNGLGNTLTGLQGNDTLDGGLGADTMNGGSGNDLYIVDNLGDEVSEAGGAGLDLVQSSVSFTLGDGVEKLALTGAAGSAGTGNGLNNRLEGNDGANLLSGLGGVDTILGGDGNDTLVGGIGADRLYGEAGADTISYGSAAEGGDVVYAFVPGTDEIEVSAAGFGGGLVAGALPGARFVVNTDGSTTAPSGTGQFIYESDIGRLWWDADGVGGAAKVAIATFSGAPALTASDIHVIA